MPVPAHCEKRYPAAGVAESVTAEPLVRHPLEGVAEPDPAGETETVS